jgi:hypothetical protein
MKLTDLQQQVSDNPARFRVIAAGRRWGKSWLSMNELAKFSVQPNQRCMYVAPTYRQAKTIMWSELKDQLIARRWVKKINESELSIKLINNSEITIRSTDNYDALRGGKYNFIVMDECADMAPEAWYQVLRPTLSDTLGHAMFITSPKGRNWIYDLYVNAQIQSDWHAFQYTTLSGGNVPQSEIEAARRDLDERTFQQEYEAEFVNYAGVIFYAYSDDLHLKPWDTKLMTARTPLFIGCDFNNSPITAVISVKNSEHLHIIDEIQIYGSNTDELVAEIKTRYGSDRQINMFPDATGSRTNTNSMGVSDHMILQRAGFNVITAKTNPPVNETIVSVNSLFKSNRLTIDPKCKYLRESVLKYVYKEGTRVPLKDNVHDHMADCLRYLSEGMFPYTRNQRQTVGVRKAYRTL